MPITRRRRANPPEQPENNNQAADQPDNTTEAIPGEQTPADSTVPPTPSGAVEAEQAPTPTHSSAAEHVENTTNTAQTAHISQAPNPVNNENNESALYQPVVTSSQPPASSPALNGERIERQERQERPGQEHQGQERQESTPPTPLIEGGRRTARGELFRRPPQPPQVQQAVQPLQPAVAQSPVPPIQAPSHEITLPLGKRPGDTHGDPLHLAYNPGYTGSDEVRSVLLHHLAQESKAGGRARCWSCGSIAIVYDRWNTRSKTFGEIGVAMCEICGVWSVM